jgi:hypothetical protein
MALTTDCPIHGRTACDPALGHCLLCARIAFAKPPCQDEREGQNATFAATPSAANETQVGGSHYRAEYQHWDFVADLELDYFQACASKYVTRWRKKNGLEDLHKAPHYMQKRQELDKPRKIVRARPITNFEMEAILRLAMANGLDAFDAWCLVPIVARDWDKAIKRLHLLIDRQEQARA